MTKSRRQVYASATRFARQGKSYSDTRVECDLSAKVGRDIRASKLASLANNL
ncbi:MAG: hypothetical protein AAB830_00980 [Patescibacteria group bacterium]